MPVQSQKRLLGHLGYSQLHRFGWGSSSADRLGPDLVRSLLPPANRTSMAGTSMVGMTMAGMLMAGKSMAVKQLRYLQLLRQQRLHQVHQGAV